MRKIDYRFQAKQPELICWKLLLHIQMLTYWRRKISFSDFICLARPERQSFFCSEADLDAVLLDCQFLHLRIQIRMFQNDRNFLTFMFGNICNRDKLQNQEFITVTPPSFKMLDPNLHVHNVDPHHCQK